MSSILRIGVVFSFGLALAGCVGGNSSLEKALPKSSKHVNNKTKFSAKAYGVAASPRMTVSRNVRKGGGRRQIGKPYKIRGRWYTPREEPGYDKVGNASWYGPNFHGRLTANGEIYDQYALSAAHPTFPLPSYARVTNIANGRSVIVRVNDRGPYHAGRVIDLSARASELLDYQKKGVAKVRVRYIGQAPLHGLDEEYLSASYRAGDGPQPVTVALAGVGRNPPVKRPKQELLDPLKTGGVAKAEPALPANDGQDPFLKELAAVKAKKDTGTTVSLRLSEDRVLNGK